MNVEQVQARIAEIQRTSRDDPEAAHGMEDRLMRDVLQVIANGATNGAELAEAALKVRELPYQRWYA